MGRSAEDGVGLEASQEVGGHAASAELYDRHAAAQRPEIGGDGIQGVAGLDGEQMHGLGQAFGELVGQARELFVADLAVAVGDHGDTGAPRFKFCGETHAARLRGLIRQQSPHTHSSRLGDSLQFCGPTMARKGRQAVCCWA